MTEDTDNELVLACLNGNTSAFAGLIEKYQKAIFNTALRLVGDADEAKDITQEVFIRAYENLESFKPEYKFFSWIYKMTLNRSINEISRRKHQAALDSEIISPEEDPGSRIDARRLAKKIQEAITELSIDLRVVIILRHFADLSYRELSFVLEIPEKTVKSRLFSARQRLGDILARQGIVEYGL